MLRKFHFLHDQIIEILCPRFGVAEFVQLEHEEADDAQQQEHHANAHVQDDCVYFLRLLAGAGVRTNAEQLQNAANGEEEADQRHHTDRQQNEPEAVCCISIADEANACHTVAIHFAQRHYSDGQYQRQ